MTEAIQPGEAPTEGIDADHNGLTRMGQQLTRGAPLSPSLTAGGNAGQPCGGAAANQEQENH
jgi:hypothetical protein